MLTSSLESNDNSNAYIWVTGNITVKRRNVANTDDIELGTITQVVFKKSAPFKDRRTEINDTFIDHADFANITMSMYNLIEYRDNYSDTSGSLWDFKRDEIVDNANVTKYKASIIGNTENTGTKDEMKIAAPLK